METIYNHNVSPIEIKALSKMIPGRRIDEESIYEKYPLEEDIVYADLFRLYSIRKNMTKALEFFNRIKDPTLKFLLKDS